MAGKDEIREERITMEIVVDAYDSGEVAMGWYHHLQDKISFPFTAECISTTKRTPLKLAQQVTVLDMADADECEYDMYVEVQWDEDVLAIPLEQIKPLDSDDETVEAIGDWHYWKSQGYSF